MANSDDKNDTKNDRPKNSFQCDQEENLSFISDDNLFFVSLVFVEILGLILIGLSVSWMLQIGGFGLKTSTIFNYHPPLMTLGMIFLNANGLSGIIFHKLYFTINF